MTLLLYIILFLFILVILVSIQLYTKSHIEKNNIQENFCQNIDDKCMMNEKGEHNCCKGTYCVRKDGNFEYKVCSDKPDYHEKNNNTNQNSFQKFITDTVGKFVEFENDIDDDLNYITEEEQFVLNLKDACSHPYKIKIPNLFYKKNKNNKKNKDDCDCSKINKDYNYDDNDNLFGDINMQNCQIFPI